MSLGSGWDQLYHTGLTPGVLKCAWDQGGINYIALGFHMACFYLRFMIVGSIISHWFDTWSAVMFLGSGWYQLYHTGCHLEC